MVKDIIEGIVEIIGRSLYCVFFLFFIFYRIFVGSIELGEGKYTFCLPQVKGESRKVDHIVEHERSTYKHTQRSKEEKSVFYEGLLFYFFPFFYHFSYITSGASIPMTESAFAITCLTALISTTLARVRFLFSVITLFLL